MENKFKMTYFSKQSQFYSKYILQQKWFYDGHFYC